MRTIKILLFLYAGFLSLILDAQQPMEICGYQHEVDKILKQNPDFLKWQNEWILNASKEYTAAKNAKRSILADTLSYEIPVVYHVIYNTTAQNIPDSLLLNQIYELNLDYRKLNSDTTRIRSIFKPLAADIRIQFKLATKDPNGNPSNGIKRVSTSVTTFANNIFGGYNENMKSTANGGDDAWDPTKYLNLWVCNMEYPGYIGIVYGFATPPTGAPNWNPGITVDTTDGRTGIVLHYKIVGKNNPLAPVKYKEGNTATHEVGHFLGLRHIWGDAPNANQGCDVDDGIGDTPNSKDKNALCSNPNLNTCTDASNDLPDMTENYMDYTLDGCAAMFSSEQAYMMRYVLNNFRTGLPTRTIVYDTIKDNFPNTIVSVYPNPSNGLKNITILINDNNNEQKFNVRLIDITGKHVIEKKVDVNIKTDLYVEPYESALYYLVITDKDNKIINKQILQITP